MSATAVMPPRKAKTYHHNNSLLFQFILIEFIEAYGDIQRLDVLCNRKPTALSDSHPNLHNPDTRKQIEGILHKLTGTTRDYMRLFSWNFGDGLLAKLKNNCGLFIHNAVGGEKELIALLHYADKIWLGCLQASDALSEPTPDLTTFLAAVEKASSSMQRFAKQMARIAMQFREDENVLFCILRYKESLDKLYGQRFVTKLFCRMYPKGLREVQQFLSQRYAARGFDNVMPAIAVKIAELEMASL